ncbi:hypothetical protein OIDMADRAFT_61007 [Oidiodendron maius Zn]|uniref:Uncharacterized protein n=1 Tax=Oidiodendron maius (strain Zn) TaxID=913774 RepID=A0A0C3GDD4_OIDMZ|nr:hypothetical protein OIDMADRAFT_61007 [Oidiodendron maius Zn]
MMIISKRHTAIRVVESNAISTPQGMLKSTSLHGSSYGYPPILSGFWLAEFHPLQLPEKAPKDKLDNLSSTVDASIRQFDPVHVGDIRLGSTPGYDKTLPAGLCGTIFRLANSEQTILPYPFNNVPNN